MKRILGLDLGTTSIGWALVDEAENSNEQSKIIRTGVRVNPLSSDEQSDFEKGKSISINADRTLKRGMRRNLDRYQDRRENLIEVLIESRFIKKESILSEEGKATHSTYAIRAKAATDGHQVSKEDLARVFLMINKKRGYKSNRKAKDSEEGQLIDGMSVAKRLYEENKTPGEMVFDLILEGKKYVPDFYRSDLQQEFDRIWKAQKNHHPEILTESFYDKLQGLSKTNTAKAFKQQCSIYTADNKAKDKKHQHYQWRKDALIKPLAIEEVAYVLTEVNNQINQSSGYLGAISDRSKQLIFNQQTVGQNLYSQLAKDPNTSLKNQVFYRQDYLDEFEKIWSVQSAFYPEMTNELKAEIRDVIIFYQRRLKSQKGLISVCELEGKETVLTIDGKQKKKTIGSKVAPKSSHLFQEFKVWQRLNDTLVFMKEGKSAKEPLTDEQKEILFEELNVKGKLKKEEALKFLFKNHKELDLNFDELQGNETNRVLYEAFLKIVNETGHGEYSLKKLGGKEAVELVKSVFDGLAFNTAILDFDPELEGKAFEQQPAYLFWHLLYSYEGDNSKTGNDSLISKLKTEYGFDEQSAKILSNVTFQDDYGHLSTKALRKILPHLKDGLSYDKACAMAGYNHSHSETNEDKDKRTYDELLELLPKNSLRNPVVEKILNQMVNVVNTIIATYGKPDEIRLEMARELKKSNDERKEMTQGINRAKDQHEKIRELLQNPNGDFKLSYVSRNDIIRYKLWMELKPFGYKTLYTNTYISPEQLFSKEIDIEHIIPKSRLFDDSFSNKTLEFHRINQEKDNDTAFDYISKKQGEDGVKCYEERVNNFFYKADPAYRVSKGKYKKLLMKGTEIPEGFIDRDLRDSQYIAKKAKQMLENVFREVNTTTGSITDRLRNDWQLVNVLQELNWTKYNQLGLTYFVENREDKKLKRIEDWTKRNDHRHHAMDAITVAFTKKGYVQYLNTLNARADKTEYITKNLYRNRDGKLCFNPPIPLEDFRSQAKEHLEKTLISFKAKNKVVTRNKNKTKKKNGHHTQIELTPRGQLHLETIYGSRKAYQTKEEKVGAKMTLEVINKVANQKYRNALLTRLQACDNDPKKAFTDKNAFSKKPLFTNEMQTDKVPDKVKLVWLEDEYTIRKEITPELKVDKVIDPKIGQILKTRLSEFGGDAKKAFSNLEDNPIWLKPPLPQNDWKNSDFPTKAEQFGIPIKRVKIKGINNAISLHEKHDHNGKPILNEEGKPIPVSFVNTGNNHHVAIYRDEMGNLQERVVSFFEAVTRAKLGYPIIDKTYRRSEGWEFLFTMKQNEMFVFPNEKTGFDPANIDLMNEENYKQISPNLFRVQKISRKNYVFNHHLETQAVNGDTLKKKNLSRVLYHFIQTPENLNRIVKVRVNHLGAIVHIGEY